MWCSTQVFHNLLANLCESNLKHIVVSWSPWKIKQKRKMWHFYILLSVVFHELHIWLEKLHACKFELTHLCWSKFNVEVVSFIGEFDDLGPDKSVDPKFFSVELKATCTHAQHNDPVLRVLQQSHQNIQTIYCSVWKDLFTQILGILIKFSIKRLSSLYSRTIFMTVILVIIVLLLLWL